jgi:hypothetical protein
MNLQPRAGSLNIAPWARVATADAGLTVHGALARTFKDDSVAGCWKGP